MPDLHWGWSALMLATIGCGSTVVVEGGHGGAPPTSPPTGASGAAGGPSSGGTLQPAGSECLEFVAMTESHTEPDDPCVLCITWGNTNCLEQVAEVIAKSGPCAAANQCVALQCMCSPPQCNAAACSCIDKCLAGTPPSCNDNYAAYFQCLQDKCETTCLP